MLTGVVSEFTGAVVATNNLKTYTSASLEAHAKATVSTKAIWATGGGRTRMSRTRVTDSSGAKDSVSLRARM